MFTYLGMGSCVRHCWLKKMLVLLLSKYFPSYVFIVVDVFDFTSKWNLDFKHPVVLL
jgi:hypothetical protein